VPIRVRFITDPACPCSWSVEPAVRKLMVEFGEELQWTWVMGGLARSYDQGYADAAAGIGGPAGPFPGLVSHWLTIAGEGRMPLDPRLWSEGPISSTYPACMAAKAAAEQGSSAAYAYLRAVREGLMCFRRKLDTTEALVEEARRARLDVDRFRSDLASHATVEAFGADLEEARTVPDAARAEGQVRDAGTGGRERVAFPTAVFLSEAGERHAVFGMGAYQAYRAAAEAAGARPLEEGPPAVLDALRRFGTMAAAEVEALCDLPEPRAAAELWRLATEWKVRPTRVLTGYLWEVA
jgi:protein-disulfide isomerase-like protein with CxxC motif